MTRSTPSRPSPAARAVVVAEPDDGGWVPASRAVGRHPVTRAEAGAEGSKKNQRSHEGYLRTVRRRVPSGQGLVDGRSVCAVEAPSHQCSGQEDDRDLDQTGEHPVEGDDTVVHARVSPPPPIRLSRPERAWARTGRRRRSRSTGELVEGPPECNGE